MALHRSKVGDLVRTGGSASANRGETFMDAIVHSRSGGVFEVTACLPETSGEAQYRVRGGHDRSERVVRERQLVSAVGPRPSS